MKILVVDDDKLDRMVVKRNLAIAKSNFDLTEVSTAKQALECLHDQHFDLVLLDYNLPDQDGIEVLKTIKRGINNDIAVVMLSHLDNEILAQECIKLGAQDFLKKEDVTASRLKQSILFAKVRDDKEQRLIYEYHSILKIAERDSLTGLANRYHFEESIEKALVQANRDKTNLAVVMIDLDYFKEVNDTLGHAAGDELLKTVAKRLKTTVREGDTLCRLGGDEFVILIPQLEDEIFIHKFVERLFKALKEPLVYNETSIKISTSLGVAMYPENASDSTDLMKCADVALYRSKESGRNQSHFYSADLHQKIKAKITLENQLKSAIENNQFIMHFQPLFDSTGTVLKGIEAFVRWQKNDGTLGYPSEFIPMIESLGLINQLGDWVISSVSEQYALWKSKYQHQLNISISANIASSQLDGDLLITRLESAFKAYNIEPSALQLEVLESAFSENSGAVALLANLRSIGVSLILDNFGSGYTSFSNLQHYPISLIKIDKAFIETIKTPEDCIIVEAMCNLAKKLNYMVAIKGIETQEQFNLCSRIDFDQIQGFFFGKPVNAQTFEEMWLKQEN
jgi:diguanylate cyclase